MKRAEINREEDYISLEEIKNYVIKRAAFLTNEVSEKKMTQEFGQASSKEGEAASSDMGISGGMFMDVMAVDALMDFLDVEMTDAGIEDDTMTDIFNKLIIAGPEGLAIIWNDKVEGQRNNRVLDLYPEGRSQTVAQFNQDMAQRFNSVSNQNNIQGELESELAKMHDILKKIDVLLASDVKVIVSNGQEYIEDIINRTASCRDINSLLSTKYVMSYRHY